MSQVTHSEIKMHIHARNKGWGRAPPPPGKPAFLRVRKNPGFPKTSRANIISCRGCPLAHVRELTISWTHVPAASLP